MHKTSTQSPALQRKEMKGGRGQKSEKEGNASTKDDHNIFPPVLGIEPRCVLPQPFLFFISRQCLTKLPVWPQICDPPVSASSIAGIYRCAA